MTQAEFAQRAGVSVGCLAMFETGARTPRAESLKRIANAAGLSTEQLLEWDERPPAGTTPEDIVDVIASLLAGADPEFLLEIKRRVLSHLLTSEAPAARRVIENLHLAPERREEVQSRAPSSTGDFRDGSFATGGYLKNGSEK